MPPDDARLPSREKLLFLSFTYPSSNGTGTQLRGFVDPYARDPLRCPSHDRRLYPERQRPTRSCDEDVVPGDCLFAHPAEHRDRRHLASGQNHRPACRHDHLRLRPADAADWILSYFKKKQLDRLFVFRFDALHFVQHRLGSFPLRELDLDELPSRRQVQLDRIQSNFQPETNVSSQKTARATARVLEKVLIPRFHRVFVSSAVEADEVRRVTGFQQPLVLPNVYPTRDTMPKKRSTIRSELLFVGSLFCEPNFDAVLYFCREILPLIQKKKGDAVLFRIVGAGSTAFLEGVRNQPGVDLVGYQEDLTPFYAQASVVVVPLRAGTGTRLKILQAFAHRRVVVSTTIGAEGIDVTDGKNIVLADSPDAFANACIKMIDEPSVADEICENAARLHRDHYSDEALLRCYAGIQAPRLIPSLSAVE